MEMEKSACLNSRESSTRNELNFFWTNKFIAFHNINLHLPEYCRCIEMGIFDALQSLDFVIHTVRQQTRMEIYRKIDKKLC